MLDVLGKYRLITLGNRQLKAIYNALGEFFARDIGTYESVRGFKFEPITHQTDFDDIERRIDFILKDINKPH